MSMSNAQLALTAAVLSTLGAIPVERENAAFSKPTDAKWCRFTYLPNVPEGETLGDLGEDKQTGIAQVDFFYPIGQGDAAAIADAETFRAAYKVGHSFIANGQTIVISKCGRSPGRLEDNWFHVSVTVNWYALIPR